MHIKNHKTRNQAAKTIISGFVASVLCVLSSSAEEGSPTPGYVAPMTMAITPDYADDTRGVFVPSHSQHRMRTGEELEDYRRLNDSVNARMNGVTGNKKPLYAQPSPQGSMLDKQLNQISNAPTGVDIELNRIAGDSGALMGGQQQPQQLAMMQPQQQQYMAGNANGMSHLQQPQQPKRVVPQGPQIAQVVPSQTQDGSAVYQSLPTMTQAFNEAPTSTVTNPVRNVTGEGVEIAIGAVKKRTVDMANAVVKLQEERITIRRALQRMMDQIGGGSWNIIWDLAETNAALPDMEISVFAEEPFLNVLNALLARVQTRSGQPLRVIRYDNTERLIITDRTGGHRLAGSKTSTASVGVAKKEEVAVTESVLKEAMVSLHYDEVPLVDALENIVNQAGKGEWRLRVYAGLDQVLKPAHIEEPFAIAMERLLKLFNLKYEIFPGGKLIVITHNNRFGFRGVE